VGATESPLSELAVKTKRHGPDFDRPWRFSKFTPALPTTPVAIL